MFTLALSNCSIPIVEDVVVVVLVTIPMQISSILQSIHQVEYEFFQFIIVF
jgi:hypothetical protein